MDMFDDFLVGPQSDEFEDEDDYWDDHWYEDDWGKA